MKQYGFFFDCSLCVGCGACQFACREANQLAPGQYFRRLLRLEPEAGLGYVGFFSAGCAHCLEPACVDACPNGAMYRDTERGLVLHDGNRCIGCSTCVWACPYGAVSISPKTGKAQKCTGCTTRTEQGMLPACVSSCPVQALRFGPITELEAMGGSIPEAGSLPDCGKTVPSLRIRKKTEGKL